MAATASFSVTEAPVWAIEHERGNYSQIFVPWGEKELTQTRWTVVERDLFQMFFHILPKVWRLERNDKLDRHYERSLYNCSYFIKCTLNVSKNRKRKPYNCTSQDLVCHCTPRNEALTKRRESHFHLLQKPSQTCMWSNSRKSNEPAVFLTFTWYTSLVSIPVNRKTISYRKNWKHAK